MAERSIVTRNPGVFRRPSAALNPDIGEKIICGSEMFASKRGRLQPIAEACLSNYMQPWGPWLGELWQYLQHRIARLQLFGMRRQHGARVKQRANCAHIVSRIAMPAIA
jgi:hypothetical protein